MDSQLTATYVYYDESAQLQYLPWSARLDAATVGRVGSYWKGSLNEYLQVRI